MASNPFSNLSLNIDQISGCLQEFGAENVRLKEHQADKFHCTGNLGESNFLINVFAKNNGTTSLGYAVGYDRAVFDVLAAEIKDKCSYSDRARFDVAVANMDKGALTKLAACLAEAEIRSTQQEVTTSYQLQRFQGPRGDVVTVKQFNNGTVQFQGKYAQVATVVMDFLQNELDLVKFVEQQIAVCKVAIDPKEIIDELKARYPGIYDFADDKVRKQFSAALTLLKLDIPLEDYSAVAFPALRGLEGIIKQMLIKAKFAPGPKDAVGSYFEAKIVGKYTLTPVNATHAGPDMAGALSDAYTEYYNDRHPLFHMESMVETTKVLSSMGEASDIVNRVLNCAETNCQKTLRL